MNDKICCSERPAALSQVILEPGAVLWPAREDHPDLEAPVHSALHAGVDGSGAIIAHALDRRRADRADPDRCDRRRPHERHVRLIPPIVPWWSR